MNTELVNKEIKYKYSLRFCKWCNSVIHKTRKEKEEFCVNFCDKFCQDEFNFNRDLKNKFLGKYNLIDQDIVAEELKEKGEIPIDILYSINIKK